MHSQYNGPKTDYPTAKPDGGSYQPHKTDGLANYRADGAGNNAALRPVASKEFQSLFSDVQDLFKSATSLTGDELSKAKDAVLARIETAKKSLNVLSADVVTRSRAAAKVTDDYVRAKPWQSVGIGAAAGLLIGIALARRSGSRNDVSNRNTI